MPDLGCFDVTGRSTAINYSENQVVSQHKLHSAMVDEEYHLVSAHIDQAMQDKIARRST